MNAPAQKNPLAVIEQQLNSTAVQQRLMTALDLAPGDEKAQREAFKYASSVMAEIMKTQGSERGDLTKCTPQSICMAVVDAAQFKVSIDGRKLAYLESRWDKNTGSNVATLQITTNGFVAKIKEFYPDTEFQITPVFKGDEVTVEGSENQKTYTYKSTNPFADFKDLAGIIVMISYTNKNGRPVRDVQPISISDLQSIRSKGKSTAWNDHALERMKTAALKRAAKWHFRQNSIIQSIVDYDNTQNYDLSQQPATPTRKSIVDNINETVATTTPEPQGVTEPKREIIDADFTEHPKANSAVILEAANSAAESGVESYTIWRDGLNDEEKEIIRSHNKELSRIAKAADLDKTINSDNPPI